MLQALWFGWQWFSPRLLTAKEVAMRMKHTTEAERVAAWEAGTGCSQATYYRYRKDLLLRVAASQRVE